MHELARHTDPDDLASIVLADERNRRKFARRRARGVRGGGDDGGLASVGVGGGYDARSALVLAIVVAALAATVGWAMTIGRPEAPAAGGTRTVTKNVAPAKTEAPAKTVAAVAPAVKEGVDLAPGRVTVARSGSGGGIVKVGVANRGTEAGQGAQVLVLLDGVVSAEGTIGALDAGASGTTELSLGSCPSGRHSLVVVIDPRGQVTEADERDNSSSSSVSFDC